MPENKLSKLWYKIFNKNKYRDLKDAQRTIENLKYYNQHIYHFQKILNHLNNQIHK